MFSSNNNFDANERARTTEGEMQIATKESRALPSECRCYCREVCRLVQVLMRASRSTRRKNGSGRLRRDSSDLFISRPLLARPSFPTFISFLNQEIFSINSGHDSVGGKSTRRSVSMVLVSFSSSALLPYAWHHIRD